MAPRQELKLRADYDARGDVLYVILGAPVAVEGDGLPGGVELDFAIENGAPVGVTVIGYRRNHWSTQSFELAKIVGKHLSIDPKQAVDTIRKAVASDA
jgi:uncharacterized protein YuzE